MSKFLSGTIIVSIGVIGKVIFLLIIDKLLAVNLGLEEFGAFKLAITYITGLAAFFTLGFPSSLVRILAIESDKKSSSQIFTLSMLAVAISCLLIASFLVLFDLFAFHVGFIFSFVFFSMNTVFIGVQSGLGKPSAKVVINDIAGNVIFILYLLLYFNNDYHFVVSWVYFFYVFSAFVLNVFSLKSSFSGITLISFKYFFLKYANYIVPIYITSILTMLSTQLDKVVLSGYVSNEELSIYYAAFTISNSINLVLVVMQFMYLPKLSLLMESRKGKFAQIFSSFSAKWGSILASIPFGIALIHTDQLIKILYSNEFLGGSTVLLILCCAQWFNVSIGFTGQNLIAIGDSKRQMKIRVMSLFAGVIFLIIGTIYYGIVGAACAIALGMLLSNSLQVFALYKYHNFFGYKIQNLKTILSIFLFGTCLFLFHKYFLIERFIANLVIDLLSFIVFLLVFRLVGKRDFKMLKILS
jgi:O-antigen/teichoic acid export membrane protein